MDNEVHDNIELMNSIVEETGVTPSRRCVEAAAQVRAAMGTAQSW